MAEQKNTAEGVRWNLNDIYKGLKDPKIEKDFKEMTTRAVPVLENMEFITARLKSITENVDDQVMIARESISSIREVADNIVALERRVQERIEGPILDTVGFVAAVLKGVRTFVERVRA